MAFLNQFQIYSQKENTVTNNVLLMLSRLFKTNPQYYADYMAAIMEDSEGYEVLPSFRQQVGNKGNGVIDGYIKIAASKVIIETKLDTKEQKGKLLKYTDSFEDSEHKILIHLSKQRYSDEEQAQIKAELRQISAKTQIHFYSRTFDEFAIQLEELAKARPYDEALRQLSDDFSDYCELSGLISNAPYILRAMACGQSFDLNVEYQFYFDDANRGYRPFNYLGIYAEKSVQYIGQVENIIVADYNTDGSLDILDQLHQVSTEQKQRLALAIKDSIDSGWQIAKNHRFFLLKDFHQTDFKKTSPGGIFRVRYFDLRSILGSPLPQTQAIAQQLRQKTWQ